MSGTRPAHLHTDLWGKTCGDGRDKPYPLLGHLLDTAAAARAVCELMIPGPMKDALGEMAGSFDGWQAETELIAGWHDLGKASCAFQQKVDAVCPPWLADVEAPGLDPPEGVKDHAWWSDLLLWEYLSDHSRATRGRIAALAGGHHGVIPPHDRHLFDRPGWCRSSVDGPTGRRVDWGDDLSRLRGEITAVVVEVTGRRLVDEDGTVATAAMSLAVVVLSDWLVSRSPFIASQAESLPPDGCDIDWAAHHKRALQIASNDLRSIGLVRPKPRPITAESLLPAGAKPSNLQASIAAADWESYGITVIAAPTGDGKTEASLLAASGYNEARGSDGWYFAMPTTGTADGLLDRLNDAIPPGHKLRLSHGLARLSEHVRHYQDIDPDAREWMTGKKAMLAPFGVGTVDQMLMGALGVKHSLLRMFGVATRTVIIDEAHCFDPYMRRLLRQAVEWLGALRAPVVVMSATLPAERSAELILAYMRGCGTEPDGDLPPVPYPGWARWGPQAEFSTSGVRPLAPYLPSRSLAIIHREVPDAAFDAAMAAAAVAASKPDGCVLVVRESISRAQATYEAILEQTDSGLDGHVVLLHSRFRHRDRERMAKDLAEKFGPKGNRPKRMILIATQIVEMSLDVDFDVLITDPAPVGAILQRAGRIHRHVRSYRPPAHRAPKAQVWWRRGAGGGVLDGSRVYQRHDIKQARKVLAARPNVNVPGDVPAVVGEAEDFASDAGSASSGERAAYERKQKRANLYDYKARQGIIPKPLKQAAASTLVLLTSASESAPTGTRLGHPAVQVLPVHRNGDGYDIHWHDGRIEPLPERPDLCEELELFKACVPVVDWSHSDDDDENEDGESRGQTAWLGKLDTPDQYFGETAQRSAWQTGALSRVKLLPMDAPTTAHIAVGDATTAVEITETLGLIYRKV